MYNKYNTNTIVMKIFSHINKSGQAVMVNVQKKIPTIRTALAQCIIKTPPNVFQAVIDKKIQKGDIYSVIKIAGINGAKQTSNLIPLCHQLSMDCISIDITPIKKNHSFLIKSIVTTESKTGVEMEALSAVSIAGLTFYDMCKALSHDITITEIKILEKHGGKSGSYINS